ncbi:YadA family autotransporter adhesin [Paraburkholderia bengalensis]|uniref:YadA family autotransporter adhesin n=1 Tax=Paraburkholderia bengalensis TaxID=2747562 RepID=UPI0030157EF7
MGCSQGIAFALGNSENYQGGDDGTGPSPTVGISGWGNGSLTLTGTAGILMKNAVLMSGNQITQLAPGEIASRSTDAVNGSQLFATNQNVANLTNLVNNIGNGGSSLKYFHANSSLADSTVTGADSVAAGPAATASASNAVALGANAVADRANSVSVGSATAQRQITNMAAGTALANIDTRLANIATGNGSSGNSLKYFHTSSTLADSSAAGANTVAIGGAALASGANASALGSQATASAAASTALGSGAQATASNAVALGPGSVANRANTVSVGSLGNERQITNVADATQGTDAVNLNQMTAAIESAVVNVGTGVDSLFIADGDRNTEASQAAGTHAMAMGAAANASGTQSIASGYNAQASGNSSVAMGANAKATADHAVALGDGSVADRANTVSVGSAGNERQIANVAAGTQKTDAVNVGQLNEAVSSAVGNLPAGMTAKDYTDQQIGAMQHSVNEVAKNAYAGVAAAMAMPNLTPSQPGNTVVAAGAGNYKSGSAVGVGATYRSRDGKWLVNGALSVTTSGDAGVRAQVGYEF